VQRDTQETRIRARARPRRRGNAELHTGVPFFDHMLTQIARHGLIDMELHAEGDLEVDAHHTVEDVGIVFGQALARCDRRQVRHLSRYGHAYVPLDEALSRAVVDLPGRPGLAYRVDYVRPRIGDFDVDLLREFFQGFVNHAQVTLHLDNLRGDNAHHQAETLFKAFGRACAWR
jgi:imidazoleglycerol-phosphate dehydratase